ncbi:MAG TPA: PQQ-binding-like beta-propeller repeat protein [Trueperaceae bacterium]|nr:PQQ-binding-like beta-propeller repeat protein [Trueperaceae bacterium]
MTAAASLAFAQTDADLLNPPAGEWPQFGRDTIASRYSPLDQINTTNVTDLQLAWVRDMGYRQSFQGGPSVWNGVMYVATQTGVMALDATTGATIWDYSSPNEGTVISNSAPRGAPLIYDGKVFINLRYGATAAIDAATGEELWKVQITNEALNEGFSSMPIWAAGKVITSPTGADSGGSPGRVVALSAEDGELLWTFNIIPTGPEDAAWATWNNPPSWEAGIGGASAWNAGAFDPESGIVVWGTGQPTPWDRVDARRADPDGVVTDDLYTASWVAIDVETGELRWHRQALPGDEWDLDQHQVPTFATVDWNGTERRVAIMGSSTGYIYVVDANTGEHLADHPAFTEVTEDGEFTVVLGYDENGRGIVSEEARASNQNFSEDFEFYAVCPGLRWAHIAPPAYSPDTGLYYRPNNTLCTDFGPDFLPDDWEPGQRAWFMESGPNRPELWFDRVGGLSAFDPVTGEAVWEFTYDYGYDAGPVVTGGGLVFSAFTDRTFRAFDATTGEVLWSHVLSTGSNASSMTYEVDGEQYVATMVGKTGYSGAPSIPDYNPNIEGLFIPPTGGVSVFFFKLP